MNLWIYSRYNKPGLLDWIYPSEIFVASEEATVCKACCNYCVQTGKQSQTFPRSSNSVFLHYRSHLYNKHWPLLYSCAKIMEVLPVFAPFLSPLPSFVSCLSPVSRQMCTHIHSSRCLYVLSYVHLLVSSTSCPTSLLWSLFHPSQLIPCLATLNNILYPLVHTATTGKNMIAHPLWTGRWPLSVDPFFLPDPICLHVVKFAAWSRCWREDGEKKGRPAAKTINIPSGGDFWMTTGLSIISLFQRKPNFVCRKTSVEWVDIPLGEKLYIQCSG